MNKNTEYEVFTQDIYQTLVNEQGLTLEVRHNVIVVGRVSKHQIDVYWEYEIAGIKHKCAIECKNYTSNITIGKIRDFNSVLSDIGSINGIMVTKEGYQKGAKEFAEGYGIKLVVLREPRSEDWKGRVKTIVTTMNTISSEITTLKPIVDKEWAKATFSNEELKSLQIMIKGRNDEIWITDTSGNKIENILQIGEKLPCNVKKSTLDLKHTIKYDDAYIDTYNLGRVKIKELELSYNVSVGSYTMVTDGEKMAKAIMKDILTGEMKFLKK